MPLNARADINSHIELAQKAGPGVVNPEVFYSKQLLDTIRYDAEEYVYYRMADESPIQEKADKLMVRRWAPLQAHTIPLEEGIPPKSDKGSVEKYEVGAYQYGRYMEFTDKVDFAVVDPVIAHYTKEYSLVVMETLDLLAKETLLAVAQPFYAGGAANFEGLTVDGAVPSMTDLRLITLSMKKALVKPRTNGKYHVIASPEFYFDMISDPVVEKYMTINNTTKTMYDNSKLVPMFDMEFYETLLVPTDSKFIKNNTECMRLYRIVNDDYEYLTVTKGDTNDGDTNTIKVTEVDGYVKDSRTGQDASYVPGQQVWDLDGFNEAKNAEANPWMELKAQHILIVGKDALLRTGLSGEGQAKMYVKQKGSAGVLDPIDQRQSIGFKINSVGFGCVRPEAVTDYICIPSQVNLV